MASAGLPGASSRSVMSFHCGLTGSCRWTCLIGDISIEDQAGFLENLRTTIALAVPGQLILDILHGVSMPNAVQRKQIADVIASAPNLELVAGHAFVSNSSVGRGVLTAINWFLPAKFEEEIFSNPESARVWLMTRDPALDGTSLLRDIARAVPGFDELRW